MKPLRNSPAVGKWSRTTKHCRRGLLLALATTVTYSATAGNASTPAEQPASATPSVTLDEGDADFANWVNVTLGVPTVFGSNAAFQQRAGLPANALNGGVSEFHLEKSLNKEWLLKLDGHGLFDYHDFGLTLDLTQDERGFLRMGYDEFRTYYNGSGGYLPGADLWMPLADDELSVDRGSFWVEGGLTLPNWPALRLKYTHDFRDGRKNSTSWGQVNTPYGTRGINASFYDLDEQRDTIEGEITHTLGKTELGLKLIYEATDRDNSFNAQQFPGTADSHVTQKDGAESSLFNVHAWSSTWFNDKTLLSGGYGYTHLDTDLTGSRIYGDQFDPIYDPAMVRGPGYINLSGNSELNQQVANLSFMFSPVQNLVIVPTVQFQYQDVDSATLYRPFNPGIVAGIDDGSTIVYTPHATGNVTTNSSRQQTTIAPRLELRYTGIADWLLYARAEWEVADGDLNEQAHPVDANPILPPADMDMNRNTDFQDLLQKYAVGATWHPASTASVGMQYYYQARNRDYDDTQDSTPNGRTSFNRYPAYLTEVDSFTNDFNVRLTWRVLPTLTSTTRYDYQTSTMESRADRLGTVDSADLDTHIFSQSLTWSPLDRLYLQGSLNYVTDETTTPLSNSGVKPGLVQNAQNDYWFATLGLGYALSKDTDLLADYSYYSADNYEPGNYQVGVPYGAGATEHVLSVGMAHRINRNLRCSLRYAYFQSEDETSGNHNDFSAHVISAGLQYRF